MVVSLDVLVGGLLIQRARFPAPNPSMVNAKPRVRREELRGGTAARRHGANGILSRQQPIGQALPSVAETRPLRFGIARAKVTARDEIYSWPLSDAGLKPIFAPSRINRCKRDSLNK